MIETKSNLFAKLSLATVFTDFSSKACNFGRDVVTVASLATTDFIYIGYAKTIETIYFNHNSIYSTEAIMTLEYYNGSAWVAAANLNDDTQGLKRSGFIKWDRAQTNQAKNTVDGNTGYFYRISLSAIRLGLIIAGINLVFADDYELSVEQPIVMSTDFIGSNSSYILTHVSTRNEILQSFRNKDYYKLDENGVKQDVNSWDLLQIDEIKQAAVYLAISKIFFNASDMNHDIYAIKSIEYRNKYVAIMNVAALSVDFNDNGVTESYENKANKLNSTYRSR